MKEKRKKTIKIVDKSSINYTFKDNNPIYNLQTEVPKDESVQKPNTTKTSIKDIKKSKST